MLQAFKDYIEPANKKLELLIKGNDQIDLMILADNAELPPEPQEINIINDSVTIDLDRPF